MLPSCFVPSARQARIVFEVVDKASLAFTVSICTSPCVLVWTQLTGRTRSVDRHCTPSHTLIDAACEGVAPSAAAKDGTKRFRGEEAALNPDEATAAARIVAILALGDTETALVWPRLRPPVRRLVARLVCAVAEPRKGQGDSAAARAASAASCSSSSSSAASATPGAVMTGPLGQDQAGLATEQLLDQAVPGWRRAARAPGGESSAAADSMYMLHPMQRTAWLAACCRVLLCSDLLRDDSLACRRQLHQRRRLLSEAAAACMTLGVVADEVQHQCHGAAFMSSLSLKTLAAAFGTVLRYVTEASGHCQVKSAVERLVSLLGAAQTANSADTDHSGPTRLTPLVEAVLARSHPLLAGALHIDPQPVHSSATGRSLGRVAAVIVSSTDDGCTRTATTNAQEPWAAVAGALQTAAAQSATKCMAGAAGSSGAAPSLDSSTDLAVLQDVLSLSATVASTSPTRSLAKRARAVVQATRCAEALAAVEDSTAMDDTVCATAIAARHVEAYLWDSQ